MAWDESKAWLKGRNHQKLYQAVLDDAAGAPARNAKRRKIVHPDDMPWELSRQGLLKHLINEGMNTRMETVDAYMLIIPPGSRSGKHRHLAEECLYVLEGRGYDLHQDCEVEITDTYHWEAQAEVKRYEWGTMEGGSTAGYFAIRVKSDVLYEQEREGERTQEKYCGRPGRYCGLVLLLEVETGLPLALLNDGFLQHVRVAADSAIGAEVMARHDSRVLGMLGSGGMARAHVEGLVAVRKIERMQVFSPTRDHRERFASEMRERHGVEVITADEPGTACRGADILAACTDSATPVLRGEWLEPGMHVISIGGRPHRSARELFDRVLRLGTAPAPIGRPELGTADEYLGYLARPSDPRWRAMRAGQASPQVT